MLDKIAAIANKLDKLGLTKEADVLDRYITKVAQVATTGVAGATYQEGRQVTPGMTGGTVKKFYRAKPKTISEFNQYLGQLVEEIGAFPSQGFFTQDVIANPPSAADTTWNSKTEKAFAQYAAGVGKREAGIDWQSFAKKNGYEPTMFGVYKFWEDTIETALAFLSVIDSGEKEEGVIREWTPEPSPPPKETPSGSVQTMSAPLPEVNVQEITRYVRMNAFGGTGFRWRGQPGDPEKLQPDNPENFLPPLLKSIKDPAAIAWFSRPPSDIFPLPRKFEMMDSASFRGWYEAKMNATDPGERLPDAAWMIYRKIEEKLKAIEDEKERSSELRQSLLPKRSLD